MDFVVNYRASDTEIRYDLDPHPVLQEFIGELYQEAGIMYVFL